MSPPPEEALFIHSLPVDLGAVVMLTALDLVPLFFLASWLSLWNLTLNSHLQPAPPPCLIPPPASEGELPSERASNIEDWPLPGTTFNQRKNAGSK